MIEGGRGATVGKWMAGGFGKGCLTVTGVGREGGERDGKGVRLEIETTGGMISSEW